MNDRDPRTIYCGNLDERVTEVLLHELFLQAGPLESVKILKSRNFGFVTFKDEVSVQYSIALMHGLKLFGKELRLEARGNNTSLFNPYMHQIMEHMNSMSNVIQNNHGFEVNYPHRRIRNDFRHEKERDRHNGRYNGHHREHHVHPYFNHSEKPFRHSQYEEERTRMLPQGVRGGYFHHDVRY